MVQEILNVAMKYKSAGSLVITQTKLHCLGSIPLDSYSEMLLRLTIYLSRSPNFPLHKLA